MLKTKKFQELTFHYRGNTVDERVMDQSFEKDVFYKELIDFKEQENMTIIDVGAHIGTFSVLSSRKFMHSAIISIEPNPESFSILRKNIEHNCINNVSPLEAALTDKSGPVKLYLSQENWLHSITNDFGGDYLEVPGVTLEEIFKKYRVSQCDLIKMNCEGAEFKIVPGLSLDILARIKMIVILFHEDLVKSGYNRKALISYLKKNGFSVRTSLMRKDRGWIVAKNKHYYNDFRPGITLQRWHFLIKNSIQRWLNLFKKFLYQQYSLFKKL